MITTGTKAKIVKGCKNIELPKGVSLQVLEIKPLGADYSHKVSVVVKILNGFQSGKTLSFTAIHQNRLSDPTVRLHGNWGLGVIEIQETL